MVLMGRTPRLGMCSIPKAKDIEIAMESMKTLDILSLKDKAFTKISGVMLGVNINTYNLNQSWAH